VPTKIVSFGFNNGRPDYGQNDTILDVRNFLDPWYNKKLRSLRGTDKEVQAEVRKTENFNELYSYLVQRTRNTKGTVYFGCAGGHHRSVSLAEMISTKLILPVQHRDILVPSWQSWAYRWFRSVRRFFS
jgi:UPF0042 nucleotide-binding protein